MPAGQVTICKKTHALAERDVLWTDEMKLLILGRGASVCQMALKR